MNRQDAKDAKKVNHGDTEGKTKNRGTCSLSPVFDFALRVSVVHFLCVLGVLAVHSPARGFPLARVSVEGPRARLGWISFEGNHSFTDDQLRRLISLDDRIDFDSLQENLARLRKFYRDAGYIRAEIGTPRIEILESEGRDDFPLPFRRRPENRVYLTIPLREGRQYSLGTISLPPELDAAELSPPASGRPYCESELVAFRQRALASLKEKGNLVKEFQIYQRIDDARGEVDLRLEYETLPPLVVRRIEFVGHDHYPDAFYRRELLLREEQIFDRARLEQSLRRLKRTGVLTALSPQDVELVVRQAELEVDIVIRLHEKKRQKIFYSLGSDGLGGTEAGLFYSVVNLLGWGEELGVEVSTGSQTSGWAVSLLSRYLFGTQVPVSFALQFFRRHTGFELPGLDEKVRKLFESERTGLAAAASYRIREDQEVGVSVLGEKIKAPSEAGHLVLEPFWSRSRYRGNREEESLRLAQRFSIFRASRGNWNLRPDLDYRRFFSGPQAGSPEWAFRFHASHARFFGDPPLQQERLFLDALELRGFSGSGAAPWARLGGKLFPAGGDTLLTTSAEYRLPLNEAFALAPFLDTGLNTSLAEPQSFELLEETTGVWRASLGTELRIRLPRQLPAARLIFAWNPLRLDRELAGAGGLTRLRDPALAFRLAFDPIF